MLVLWSAKIEAEPWMCLISCCRCAVFFSGNITGALTLLQVWMWLGLQPFSHKQNENGVEGKSPLAFSSSFLGNYMRNSALFTLFLFWKIAQGFLNDDFKSGKENANKKKHNLENKRDESKSKIEKIEVSDEWGLLVSSENPGFTDHFHVTLPLRKVWSTILDCYFMQPTTIR